MRKRSANMRGKAWRRLVLLILAITTRQSLDGVITCIIKSFINLKIPPTSLFIKGDSKLSKGNEMR